MHLRAGMLEVDLLEYRKHCMHLRAAMTVIFYMVCQDLYVFADCKSYGRFVCLCGRLSLFLHQLLYVFADCWRGLGTKWFDLQQ